MTNSPGCRWGVARGVDLEQIALAGLTVSQLMSLRTSGVTLAGALVGVVVNERCRVAAVAEFAHEACRSR